MKKLTCAVFTLILFFTAQSIAATITVKADGSGDYPTIQAAINIASPSDEVVVGPGTYTGNGNRDIDFLGKAITVKSENGPNDCIIDCQGTETDPHRGFNFQSGEDTNSVLEGFTITNGYGPVTSIYLPNRWCYYTFYGNGASSRCSGGGRWRDYSLAGAIFCESSSPTINNCIISENYAEYFGGAIVLFDSATILKNSAIKSNLTRCGGGIFTTTQPQGTDTQSYSQVLNCVFSENNATSSGGAIYIHDGDVKILNTVITENDAGFDGGGVCILGGNIEIDHCAILENTTGYDAGGISFHDADRSVSCNATISNSIIWANTKEWPYYNQPQISYIPSEINVDLRYCLIEGGYPYGNPVSIFDFEPGFIDTNAGNYHLALNSFCINAGDPNYNPASNPTDFEGDPRIMDGRTDLGVDEAPCTMPIMELSTKELLFEAAVDSKKPCRQTVSIDNRGTGVLNWQIDEDCPWLDVRRDSGSVKKTSDSVTVIVDVSGLAIGIYQYQLQVNGENTVRTATIDVTLKVGGDVIIVPDQVHTIGLALDLVLDSGTVIVRPGSYHEHVRIPDRNILLTSLDPSDPDIVASTTIDYDNPNAYGSAVSISGKNSKSTIMGFNINGGVGGSGSDAIISNCILQDNCGYCGTIIFGFDGTIKNSLIADNSRCPCFCICPTIEASSCTIENSTIANSSISFSNNGPKIKNSIIYNGSFIAGYNLNTAPGISYSNLYNVWGDVVDTTQLGLYGPGNISAYPSFIEGSYRPSETSPCINAGDPNYVPEPDEIGLDGMPRVMGSRIDMGAYEFPLPGPLDFLKDLAQDVIDLELHQGTENSLLAKLDTAIEKLQDDNEKNDAAAVNALQVFINAVQAQSGKKIPESNADNLISAVQQIIELLTG